MSDRVIVEKTIPDYVVECLPGGEGYSLTFTYEGNKLTVIGTIKNTISDMLVLENFASIVIDERVKSLNNNANPPSNL